MRLVPSRRPGQLRTSQDDACDFVLDHMRQLFSASDFAQLFAVDYDNADVVAKNSIVQMLISPNIFLLPVTPLEATKKP